MIQNRLKNSDKNLIIRRFLDYPKFLSLVTTKSLYFSRPHDFEDPLDSLTPEYENIKNGQVIQEVSNERILELGALVLANIKRILQQTSLLSKTREQRYIMVQNFLLPFLFNKKLFVHENFAKVGTICFKIADLLPNNSNDEQITNELFKLIKEYGFSNISSSDYNRRNTLINCWHCGTSELDSMWKLYSQTEGIAIETSIKKLEKYLDIGEYKNQGCTCVIDKIKYVDLVEEFKKANELTIDEMIKTDNQDAWKYLFMKSRCFKQEEELRIILRNGVKNIDNGNKTCFKNKEDGELVELKTTLNNFIDKIIISPYAPKYYKETLTNTLEKLGQKSLAKKVIESQIILEQETLLSQG